MATTRPPRRRITPTVALVAAAGAALAFASAATATTQCYRTDQHLIGRQVLNPTGDWAAVGKLTNVAALDVLVKGDMVFSQGFSFYTRHWKVTGVTRSDIASRPAQVDSFVSQAGLAAEGRGLSVSAGASVGVGGGAGLSLSVDARTKSASSSAQTSGTHAVFHYPASAPFLAGKIGAGAINNPTLSVGVTAVIDILNGGSQAFTVPPGGDPSKPLAKAKITLRKSDIDARHLNKPPVVIGWKKIDCRTGFDGNPPKKKHHPAPSPSAPGFGPAVPQAPSAGGGS